MFQIFFYHALILTFDTSSYALYLSAKNVICKIEMHFVQKPYVVRSISQVTPLRLLKISLLEHTLDYRHAMARLNDLVEPMH